MQSINQWIRKLKLNEFDIVYKITILLCYFKKIIILNVIHKLIANIKELNQEMFKNQNAIKFG